MSLLEQSNNLIIKSLTDKLVQKYTELAGNIDDRISKNTQVIDRITISNKELFTVKEQLVEVLKADNLTVETITESISKLGAIDETVYNSNKHNNY